MCSNDFTVESRLMSRKHGLEDSHAVRRRLENNHRRARNLPHKTLGHGKRDNKLIKGRRQQERKLKVEVRHTVLPRANRCMEWTSAQRCRAGSRLASRANKMRTWSPRVLTDPSTASVSRSITCEIDVQRAPVCVKCQCEFTLGEKEKVWFSVRDLKHPRKCQKCRRGGSTSASRKLKAQNDIHTQHYVAPECAVFCPLRLLGPSGSRLDLVRKEHAVTVKIDFEKRSIAVGGATREAVAAGMAACVEPLRPGH